MTSLTPRLDRIESGRNLIINGNFDFWQRTTSQTVLFNQTRAAADRFVLDSWGGASASVTMARVAEVPTLEESGFNSVYSLKLTNNNAGGSAVTLRYTLEGYDYQAIHNSKVRLQFWVRSSLTGTYSVAFNNDRGLNNRYYLTTYTINTANVWQKVTIDVELDNTANWAFDNTAGLSIMFGLGIPNTVSVGKSILNSWQTGDGRIYLSNNAWATTLNANWQIAQVQLTKGDFSSSTVDLPFSRCGKNIQNELAMCQRYYESSNPLGSPTSVDYSASVYTGATTRHYVPFLVSKRNTPTISTISDATTVTGTSSMAYTIISINNYLDGSINVARPQGFVFVAPSASSTQPLRMGWTAESEIGL